MLTHKWEMIGIALGAVASGITIIAYIRRNAANQPAPPDLGTNPLQFPDGSFIPSYGGATGGYPSVPPATTTPVTHITIQRPPSPTKKHKGPAI